MPRQQTQHQALAGNRFKIFAESSKHQHNPKHKPSKHIKPVCVFNTQNKPEKTVHYQFTKAELRNIKKSHSPLSPGEKSKFSVLTEITGKIRDAIAEQFSGTIDLIKQSAAYQCFDESLKELVKNAYDAKAKNLYITIIVTEKNEVIIRFQDDGKGIPETLSGAYDWKKALRTGSEKQNDSSTTGGQKLGLATPAYALENAGGVLALSRTHLSREKPGTAATLQSPNNDAGEILLREVPKKMVIALLSEALKAKPDLLEVQPAPEENIFQNPGTSLKKIIADVIGQLRIAQENNRTKSSSSSAAATNTPVQTPQSRIRRPPGLTMLSSTTRTSESDLTSLSSVLQQGLTFTPAQHGC